jgi:hypothetical protein
MAPDMLFMTPPEKRWLEFGGTKIPEPAVTAGREPVKMVIDAGERKIGVVLFPTLPDGGDEPCEDVLRDVARAGRELRASVGLVAGMSPWGEKGEAKFLVSQGAVFHVLLGSGPGKGRLALECEQKCLWIRSYSRGLALQVFDVFEWPTNRHDWRWEFDKNFRARTIALSDNWPVDTNIHRILSDFPENPDG